MNELDVFFHPRAIAIIGATGNPVKGGHAILMNLLQWPKGRVYPVNPNYQEILGQKCYPDITAVPDPVDMAIIFTPAAHTPEILRRCGQKGIKGVLIESAGFTEVGEKGRALQEECLAIARTAGIRIWGPNCTGIADAYIPLYTTFMPLPDIAGMLTPGNVSVIAQSGTMAGGFLLQCLLAGLFGVSKACAIGNKADINECDVLEYLEHDDHTEVVAMYLESLPEGRRFREVVKRIGARKKLIMLKSARHQQSHQAAASHTGSLAGNWRVIQGALRGLPIALAYSFSELAEIAKGFSMVQRPARGKDLGIVTITGGAGIVSSDLMADHNLKLAKLSPETTKALTAINPPWMPSSNPADIWPAIEQHGMRKTLNVTLTAMLQDPEVGGILLLNYVPWDIPGEIDGPYLKELVAAHRKPVISWVMGNFLQFGNYTRFLEDCGIPVYDDLFTCVGLWRALTEIAI